jgi:hypothetical protein
MVYLITAVLAVASSVISLIEVDEIAGNDVVPVRVSGSPDYFPIISSIIACEAKGMKFFPSEILSFANIITYLSYLLLLLYIILFITILLR